MKVTRNIDTGDEKQTIRTISTKPKEHFEGKWKAGRLYPLYSVVVNNGTTFVSQNAKMKEEPYVIYDAVAKEFKAPDGWEIKEMSADSRLTALGGGSEGSVTPEEVEEMIEDKVDKVPGKGLSTNDYDDTEKGKVASAYQKPNGGIPKTDMADAVKASLDKADSAYQKPNTGVPFTDLASGIQDSLSNADEAKAGLAGKQDTISDLSAIRSGAAAGATSVQPAEFNELKDEVDTIGNGAYEEAWDGDSTPVVADIPAGVVVTYSGASYTGTLAASASTVDKIYLVSDGNGNYDRYVTVERSGTYSWKKVGTTAIPLSNYATNSKVDQLETEKTDLSSGRYNLFNPGDPDVLTGKYITGSGYIDSGSYNASGYIPVEVGKTYHCSRQMANGFRFVCFYDSAKNVVSNSLSFPVRSFTVPSGVSYARVTVSQDSYAYAQVSTIYGNYIAFSQIGGYLENDGERIASLEGKVGFTNVRFYDNTAFDLSGNIGSTVVDKCVYDANTASACCPVNGGDIVQIKVNGGPNFRGWGFLDGDGKLLQKADQGSIEATIIVPKGAAMLLCNSTEADEHFLFVTKKEAVIKLNKYFVDTPKTQLFDRDNVEVGYCSNSGWIDSGETGYVHTKKINVKDYVGHTIYFSVDGVALTTHSFRFITVYDSDGVVQPSLGIASGSMDIPTFVIPNGADSIVISYVNPASDSDMAHFQAELDEITSFADYETKVMLDFSLVKKNVDWEIDRAVNPTPYWYRSILNGKKIVACGDSFTEGDYTGEGDLNAHKFQDGPYAGSYKVWPFFIGHRTSARIQNLAVSGSCMTTIPALVPSYWPDGCFSYLRYQQIDADADYIIIKYGINDAKYLRDGDVTLGTIDSSDINTFYGAWNTVLSWIVTNRPKAKIGIIITNGTDYQDVIDAEIAIAKKYGVPYLNLATDDKVAYFYRQPLRTDVASSIRNARGNYYKMSSSNAHPNDACQEYESTIIEAWIRSL